MERQSRPPVFIVGAPRSGTSLLHRVLRGCAGCGAVAAEAQHVWQRYTHPANFEWKSETWDPATVDEGDCRRIRRRFRRDAIPASIWRRLDEVRVMERQRRLGLPAPLLRSGYHAVLAMRSLVSSVGAAPRLVEKSVHAGLWMGLVGRVFPDVTFVHITREPLANIDAIRRAWLNPGRFQSYRLPLTLALRDCGDCDWNFGLPEGWQDYREASVADVAAFQWCCIQQGIIDYCGRAGVRSVVVRLEDLVAEPRWELVRLARELNFQWDAHLDRFANGLPRVNSDHEAECRRARLEIQSDLLARVERVGRAIGYTGAEGNVR